MNYKHKKILLATLLIGFLFFVIPIYTYAQGANDTTYNFITDSGLNTTGQPAGYPSDLTSNLSSLTSLVIRQILALLGVAFLGLMIYGGISWMTAEGNDTKVDKARGIIVAGIVGFMVVAAAYGISYAVISFFTQNTIQ